MECGGNLFDAVSMAVKAALFATVIPRVTVTAVDGGEPELEVNVNNELCPPQNTDNIISGLVLSKIPGPIVTKQYTKIAS